jgi:anaerobic selenocysteine-containing dehydrogenase
MAKKERKTEKQIAEEKSSIKGGSLSGGQSGYPMTVDVKDGKILRIRPLHYDWKYDPQQFNPWTMRARGQTFEPGLKTLASNFGLAYKKRVYSPNRILYPLKRVDWNENGDRNPQNRGKSKYVRISWDEATDIIVRELRRIHKQYGPEGVLCQSDIHGEGKTVHQSHGAANKLLALLGGYTLQMRNPDSWEGWAWGAKHVWGMEVVGEMQPESNVILDIVRNSELLLFWGCDPETTPLGFNGHMASRLCFWFRELGIKSVYICPDLNYGAGVHADKWIPILPGTDAALQLAIAYVWIKEGTWDKQYVATHTLGYEKFEEYVMGKEDGVPKTPEWASPKCGIPEWTIKALAREWGAKPTTITHGNGGGAIRGPYATENGRLEVILLAMQGLGKPGTHQAKMIEWGLFGTSPMPAGSVRPSMQRMSYCLQAIDEQWSVLEKAQAKDGSSLIERKGAENLPGLLGKQSEIDKLLKPELPGPKQYIPKDLIHDAILNPPITWYGNASFPGRTREQFVKYTYPAKGCSELHMIWTDSPCWITCWNDSNTFIDALRSPKVEFMVAQHPWLENDCLFADVILPVSTRFEEKDIGTCTEYSGQYNTVFLEDKCIEPLGESKSDYEIVCLIAEKMGLLEKYTGGRSIDDTIKIIFENCGIKDLISYEEFLKKEYYVIPTDPDWEKKPAGMQGFYEEPEKHPLQTPSGLIEICSQNLTRYFPDDQERPPVPHWIEKGESHDERISGERAKKYPLLIISNHGRWRVHAQCDDVSWTAEAPTCKIRGYDGYLYEPLWMNPGDAAARGIKKGDIVKVFNERGVVLAGAYVAERMMRGALSMDHGARYDPIVPGKVDRGGAINTITPHNVTSKKATGMVVSSFLVEVQKVTRAEMDEWRKLNPEAFARKYDSASGLRFDAWVKDQGK